MSNINDYLKWRGDIRINKEFPFNELDSLIMARFSYLRFDKIDFKNECSIKTLSLQMKDIHIFLLSLMNVIRRIPRTS